MAYANYIEEAKQGAADAIRSFAKSLEDGVVSSSKSLDPKPEVKPDVKQDIKPDAKSEDKGICEYYWEEKPNYTDYTTYDQYLRKSHPSPDRAEKETLQGSGVLDTDDICANVPRLLPCFKKAWANDEKHHQNLKQWAKEQSYSINRVMLALAWRETRMGQLRDSCDNKGNCNGVGMVQVITVIADDFSESNGANQKQWQGITHNLLTNLKYGLRVLNSKVNIARNLGRGTSLKQISYYYNGSEHYAEDYSKAIVQYYEKLGKCGVSFD